MSFKEKFEGYAPDIIKRIVPLHASSFDNFARLVNDNKGKEITAKSAEKVVIVFDPDGVMSTVREYLILYESRTKDNRKIIYREVHDKVIQDESGSVVNGPLPATESMNANRLLATQASLEELRRRIPGVLTEGPIDRMDDMNRRRILNIAKNRGVKPQTRI